MPTKKARSSAQEPTADFVVAPAFMLLFSMRLARPFAGFQGPLPGVTPLPPEEEKAYLAQFADFEERLLGETFRAARRVTRWPLGRIALSGNPANAPGYADVGLLVHKSGVAVWGAWLPASEQPFESTRWIAWLDPDSDDGLVAQLWRTLGPINQEIAGETWWSDLYFPIAVLRAPQHPLNDIVKRHGEDLVRLLFLDHSSWKLKPQVVSEELEGDYCARAGGMTLLGRRCGLDLHARERPDDRQSFPGLPPRAALPFIITLEMLLIERTVLQHIYDRLSRSRPQSIEQLLILKQEVIDELEEYYGAITSATRFSDAVTVDGERLLGIVDLYEAVVNRFDAVSFEITTRYQKRMTVLQTWLTIVFGATEIGFIASGIATWYYRSELSLVLAWTVGTALVAAAILAALLRGKVD